MLDAWRDFVNEVDPDVIIGYNIANFDLPYLVDRANAVKAKSFPMLGRMISQSILSLFTTCCLTHFRRCESANKGDSLLLEGIWSARLEGDCP